MTDNAAPPTSISPPNTVVMPMPERSSSGRVWSMVALVVALMGLVLVGLLWQRLNLTQQELARRSQDAGVEAGQARSMAEQSQQLGVLRDINALLAGFFHNHVGHGAVALGGDHGDCVGAVLEGNGLTNRVHAETSTTMPRPLGRH